MSGGPTIAFTYNDPDGLYTGASGGTPFTVTRDASTGLPTAATLGILKETWTYDAFGAPATFTVTNTSTSATIYSMILGSAGTPTGRDGSGRLTSMAEDNDGRTNPWLFAYDALGRLQSATEGSTENVYGG